MYVVAQWKCLMNSGSVVTIVICVMSLCTVMFTSRPIDAQAPTREQTIDFIQNAIRTKASANCGMVSTYNSGVATQFGTLGAGTNSTNIGVGYGLDNPLVDTNNVMHLQTYTYGYLTGPGVIGAYSNTSVTMSDEFITLSRVAPNSISVFSDSCGAGVRLSGTNNSVISTAQSRTRSLMKGLISSGDIASRIQPSCAEKETKKKTCTETSFNRTELIIYFGNDPDFASRFANAFRSLVILSGGQSSAY
jgi:hypothetical protein